MIAFTTEKSAEREGKAARKYGAAHAPMANPAKRRADAPASSHRTERTPTTAESPRDAAAAARDDDAMADDDSSDDDRDDLPSEGDAASPAPMEG